jgi:thiamine-monophosphate kinase
MQSNVIRRAGAGRSGAAGGGELEILERIRARVSRPPGPRGGTGLSSKGLRLGIGDDCALLRVGPGEELAVTTDLSLAGRHFRLDWHPPEAVGHRTLARGLSDLAAMGARPVAAFLSLGLPVELAGNGKARNAKPKSARPRASWLDRFLDGFLSLAEAYRVPLAGGDLAQSAIAVADIVLVGAVPRGKALLRSGVRPGDLLYVTGRLGGAAVGLEQLAKLTRGRRGDAAQALRERTRQELDPALAAHLFPQPRVAQGLTLMRRGLARAALDLSDGLSTDLDHLCDASGVAAEIDAAALPIAAGATLEQALHGGEDYELLFAAAPGASIPRALNGAPVTRIGRTMRRRAGRPKVTLIGAEGRQPLAARGWEHFS